MQNRRVSPTSLLVMATFMFAVPACDEQDISQLQAEGLHAGSQGATRNEDGWIFLDREDIYAFSPPDVVPLKSVYYEIWDLFAEVNPKYVGNKMTVIYLGSLEPEFSSNGDISGFRYPMLPNYQYFSEQSDYTGQGVIWASFATQSLYFINYPELPQDLPGELESIMRLEDSGPTVDTTPFVQLVSDELRGPTFLEKYGRQSKRGIAKFPDNRHRVFGEDTAVSGKMFQRMLSVGPASGSLIGPRHALTAAHVVTDFEDTTNTLLIENSRIRAGRNGRTQIGNTTGFRHLYWNATWNPDLSTIDDHGRDFAWGVLEDPVGKLTGYFGYSWSTFDSVHGNGSTFRNVGYPSCSQNNAPVPPDCIPSHQFMDSNTCEIGQLQSPDLTGAQRAVQHSCDTSPGHSGSPLILTEAGSLYVWGVHVGWAGSWNYAARVTPRRSLNLISEMYRNFPRD